MHDKIDRVIVKRNKKNFTRLQNADLGTEIELQLYSVTQLD